MDFLENQNNFVDFEILNTIAPIMGYHFCKHICKGNLFSEIQVRSFRNVLGEVVIYQIFILANNHPLVP